MLIVQATSFKYNKDNNIKNSISPIFKGPLEDSFFKAVKAKDRAKQLSALHNITFDVFEKEASSGNNFLHIVCKENNDELYAKAKRLINYHKEKLGQLVKELNKENKTPLDYLQNESFRKFLNNLLKNNTQEKGLGAQVNPIAIINNTVSQEKPDIEKLQGNSLESDKLAGNEIDKEIELDDFEFGVDEVEEQKPIADVRENIDIVNNINDNSTQGFNGMWGQQDIRKVFTDEIINPVKQSHTIFTNGYLLEGISGSGKTYAIEKLAEELNREIISATYLIANKKTDAVSKIIDNSIIKIDETEVRDIGEITKLLKKHYKNTHRQGFIFLDEIKYMFNETNPFSNKVKQSIENGARNGIITLATTIDKDFLPNDVLNSMRLEKVIEFKNPNYNDIQPYIKNKLSHLSNEEITTLSKKLRGLTYHQITRYIEELLNKESTPTFEYCNNLLNEVAEKNNITDLSEEGSTAIYDTYLKRMPIASTDPQSFDDVAGMHEVKNVLKNIFSPVKNAKLLQNFVKENKIKQPNGVLLYGPPGCGKTYIMTALSADSKLPLYQLKMSEIDSKYVGEASLRIKKTFDQLRKKYKETGEPSILFFDECDSFFSKKNADSTFYQKLINTLKLEMNNAGNNGIFIVAATNEKDDLNTAIIRDGRFDTKIEIGYPDDEARAALISILLDVPILKELKTEDNINELVKLTKNFSNATISGIFSTLKFNVQNKLPQTITTQDETNNFFDSQKIDLETVKKAIANKRQEINKTNLKQRDYSIANWQAKTAAYDQYLNRTMYTETDPKSFDDVIGLEDVKLQIKQKILAPLNPKIKKVFKKNKLPLTSGIILHGPGGVGKTFIIKAAAAESKVPLYELKLSEVGTSFANETSKNIKNVFEQLKRKYKETDEPSILFLDECDSILCKVGSNNDSDLAKERKDILNTLKTELATALDNGIIVIAATNSYNQLDPNVTRSGRFSEHIKIGFPDAQARKSYLINLLAKRSITQDLVNDEVFLNELVEITENLANADIKEIVDTALINSHTDFIVETLKNQNSEIEDDEDIKLEKPSKESIKTIALRKKTEIMEKRKLDEDMYY